MKKEKELRKALSEASSKLCRLGLNHGATGNLSCRSGEAFIITPSGVNSECLKAESMVTVRFDGAVNSQKEVHKPSSEWLFHRDIYASRKDVNAIVTLQQQINVKVLEVDVARKRIQLALVK